MQPLTADLPEPVVLALIDTVKSWQSALDHALATSGINYVKWLLLRAIHHGEFTRHQPWLGQVLIDAAMSEHLLVELQHDGWIRFEARTPGEDAVPVLVETTLPRLARIAQSVRALHSVSVASFNPQERATLGALLRRMNETLSEHTARQHRLHATNAAGGLATGAAMAA